MPEKKMRILPSRSCARTGTVDLFLIAGLPNPQHSRSEGFLKNMAGQHAKVIATASASVDGPLFRRSAVSTLLRAGSQFAIRRFKNRSEDELPRPRRICLFFVPAEDDENLLSAFNFFVFPVPMHELSTFDEHGRQRRHDGNACEQAIRAAFAIYRRDLPGVVQRRVESRNSSEPLLLPPINFHTQSGRLERLFSELARGLRTWDDADPDGVAAEVFRYERLPGFLREQERQKIYRDARGVIFPCARANEMHGRLIDLQDQAAPSDLQHFLRSAYRFGAPLPDGFHHDAQLDGGRHFNNMEFQCARQGTIVVSGSHVNVYPNDYIREAT